MIRSYDLVISRVLALRAVRWIRYANVADVAASGGNKIDSTSRELELSGRGILCLLRLPLVLGKPESTQLQHYEGQVFYCSVLAPCPTFASRVKNGTAVQNRGHANEIKK